MRQRCGGRFRVHWLPTVSSDPGFDVNPKVEAYPGGKPRGAARPDHRADDEGSGSTHGVHVDLDMLVTFVLLLEALVLALLLGLLLSGRGSAGGRGGERGLPVGWSAL